MEHIAGELGVGTICIIYIVVMIVCFFRNSSINNNNNIFNLIYIKYNDNLLMIVEIYMK